MLPVMVLANPGEKPKRPQTEKQRKASLKNLKAARAAAKKKAAPSKPKQQKPKAAKPKKNPKGKDKMASEKQKAAARKNIKKAQAANKKKRGGGGKSKPRNNPSKPANKRTAAAGGGGGSGPRRRRRRNPEVKTLTAVLEVGGGLLAGGLAAGGADYMMSNYNATATPGRRALVHTGAALVVGLGGAALAPGAMGFVGGTAGAFAGLAASNGLRAWLSGSAPPAATPAQPATGTGNNAPDMGAIVPATAAHGVRAHGQHAGGVRELRPAERGMRAVITNPAALRAVVQRGPRPTARLGGDDEQQGQEVEAGSGAELEQLGRDDELEHAGIPRGTRR